MNSRLSIKYLPLTIYACDTGEANSIEFNFSSIVSWVTFSGASKVIFRSRRSLNVLKNELMNTFPISLNTELIVSSSSEMSPIISLTISKANCFGINRAAVPLLVPVSL